MYIINKIRGYISLKNAIKNNMIHGSIIYHQYINSKLLNYNLNAMGLYQINDNMKNEILNVMLFENIVDVKPNLQRGFILYISILHDVVAISFNSSQNKVYYNDYMHIKSNIVDILEDKLKALMIDHNHNKNNLYISNPQSVTNGTESILSLIKDNYSDFKYERRKVDLNEYLSKTRFI